MTSTTAITEDVRLLSQIVRQKPTDGTVRMQLIDAYMEAGFGPRKARRLVKMLAAESLVASALASSKIRTAIRQHCGVPRVASIGIDIVAGDRADQPPKLTGEAPRNTFKNGGECHAPGAAIRKGFKVIYHPDTRSITVGVLWLSELIERKDQP